MILLLDLDDTLLTNNIDTFIPVYLQALGKHLSRYVAPEIMVPCLLDATRRMVENNDPALSLEEAFDRAFYPQIGQTKQNLLPEIDQFYDEIYPKLQTLTSPRPEAAPLITELISQGHRIVVATNPLFPRKAIHHRLRWAGLDPSVIPFSLITTYEVMHFAKPNPAYLAEILAQLGSSNEKAVMVGNSMTDDLVPANQLGMPVFWITRDGESLPQDFHSASASGTLDQVPAWIKQMSEIEIRSNMTSPAALMAWLRAAPAAFATITQGLTREQWQKRPEPNEWSLAEIFCHLRDVDREVNIPRFTKIIQENNPFIPGIDTDSWAQERGYRDNDGPTTLFDFISVRRQMIAMLEALTDDEWIRHARHAIFGPTTLAELVSFVITHDHSHIQQVNSNIKRTK